MTKTLYVLNGPNLNRLGRREPQIYGATTLAEIESLCRASCALDWQIRFHQSNREYELIDWVHEAIDEGTAAILITPAAFTFTSLALLDALKMFEGPIVELHISNVHKREELYHTPLISRVATAVMAGFGAQGYGVAVRALTTGALR